MVLPLRTVSEIKLCFQHHLQPCLHWDPTGTTSPMAGSWLEVMSHLSTSLATSTCHWPCQPLQLHVHGGTDAQGPGGHPAQHTRKLSPHRE